MGVFKPRKLRVDLVDTAHHLITGDVGKLDPDVADRLTLIERQFGDLDPGVRKDRSGRDEGLAPAALDVGGGLKVDDALDPGLHDVDGAPVTRREGNVESASLDRAVSVQDRVHLAMDDPAVFRRTVGVERIIIRHPTREAIVADRGDGEVRADDHCTDLGGRVLGPAFSDLHEIDETTVPLLAANLHLGQSASMSATAEANFTGVVEHYATFGKSR
jgi:hypothetical protein